MQSEEHTPGIKVQSAFAICVWFLLQSICSGSVAFETGTFQLGGNAIDAFGNATDIFGSISWIGGIVAFGPVPLCIAPCAVGGGGDVSKTSSIGGPGHAVDGDGVASSSMFSAIVSLLATVITSLSDTVQHNDLSGYSGRSWYWSAS
jgi:hypothetical protein